MESEAIFLTLLDGADEIIKSDKACVDLIRWADEMSNTESLDFKFENMAAFLMLGLKLEIDRRISDVKSRKRFIDFSHGSGKMSDEERKYWEEKSQLQTLNNEFAKLLLEIVQRAGKVDDAYKSTVKKHEKIIYNGKSLNAENAERMQRYLETIVLFFKSLDNANVDIQQRNKYFSRIFETRRFIESLDIEPNEAQHNKQALTDHEIHHLDLLKTTELITYEGHIPRVTSSGVELLKGVYQATKIGPFTNQKDIILAKFVEMKVLDTDSLTITDQGLGFLFGMIDAAYSAGFNELVMQTANKPIDVKAMEEVGVDDYLRDMFEPTYTVLRRNLVTAILKAIEDHYNSPAEKSKEDELKRFTVLIMYVTEQFNLGKTEEQVRNDLISKGMEQEEVQFFVEAVKEMIATYPDEAGDL